MGAEKAIVAGLCLLLTGCGYAAQREMADRITSAQAAFETASDYCRQQFPGNKIVERSRCFNAASEAHIVPVSRYPDLIRLDNANRLAFAEKVQAGQMTQAEAEQAVLQARSQLTSEEQRRDSSNQIANAQMQAANAQRSMAISAAFSNIQAGMNASAPRQPTHCVSNRMGNQVVTNCN